jgi:negative regulator of flagellin synthesis FlgM
MRINNHALEAFSQHAVARTSQTRPAEPSSSAKVQSTGSSEAATVSISDEARQLAMAGQTPAESAEKVAALKDAIEKGTFQVDTRLIAQRMLDHLA